MARSTKDWTVNMDPDSGDFMKIDPPKQEKARGRDWQDMVHDTGKALEELAAALDSLRNTHATVRAIHITTNNYGTNANVDMRVSTWRAPTEADPYTRQTWTVPE